jgi:hypothetical protein
MSYLAVHHSCHVLVVLFWLAVCHVLDVLSWLPGLFLSVLSWKARLPMQSCLDCSSWLSCPDCPVQSCPGCPILMVLS